MNRQTLVVSWKSFLNMCNDWSAEKYEILCSQHFLHKILTSPHHLHVICELVLNCCTCAFDKLHRKEPEKEQKQQFLWETWSLCQEMFPKKNILENYVCKSNIWTKKHMTLIPQVAPFGQQFKMLSNWPGILNKTLFNSGV